MSPTQSPSEPPSQSPNQSPGSSQRRPLTFEDLWRLDRLGAPVPSPDGSRLVVPVTGVHWPDPADADESDDETGHGKDVEPENQTRTDLWLVDFETPDAARRLTWDGASRAAWSPCGRWLYFTRKRSMPVDQQYDTKGPLPRQLWRLPMDGPGEAERLTSMPTEVSQPKPLADGRHVAFVADTWADLGPGSAPDAAHDLKALAKRVQETKDDPVQARVTDRRLVRYWDEYRTDRRVPHVWILDLESGEVRDAMAGVDGLLHFMDFRWDVHPEGTQIAYSRNATEPPWKDVRMEIVLQELVLDALFHRDQLNGGTASEPRPECRPEPRLEPRPAPFTDESTWDNCPTYLPDGRMVFLRNQRPDVSADFSRLMVWDGSEARELVPGWDGDAGVPEVRPEGDEVVFLAHHRGHQHVYSARIDPEESNAPVEPTRLDAFEDGSAVSARPVAGGRVACLHQSYRHPSELWLLGADEPVRLGTWNAGRLEDVDFGADETESVTFAVTKVDGEGDADADAKAGMEAGMEDSQMFVLHPPGFDPSKKYPFVLLLHGGPHSAWLDSFHMRWNASLFAASGRVVAALNPHGSTGFGQAYAESIVGRHADQPFADAMAAVDLLLQRGYVDETRMAVAGGSYGGFLTSWVIGHTDRFAAAVCHAGVYDLMSQFASDYTWSRGKNYGAEPWDDPAAIDRQSPSRFADAFNTPTLVLHGEKDFRVPVTQGINLYQVLQGKGVPSKLVVFPKENHWILKPRAAQLWWTEVEAWLDRWIGSGPS